jgi:hypothetical protein
VGARELPRSAVGGCPIDPSLRRNARFSQAWLSTEGLTVEYALKAFVSCDAVMVKGRWVRCGGASAHSRDPRRIELAGGGLSVVCDDLARAPAFMWIAVPNATPWMLGDHGTFWVAYRTARHRLIRITKRSKGSGSRLSFRIAFVNERGRPLQVREITGCVAG